MYKYAILFCLVSFSAFGQAPSIVWDRTIGGGGHDSPASMVATSDGGFIVAGYSRSDISGDKTDNRKGGQYYWIVKLGKLSQTQTSPMISYAPGTNNRIRFDDNGGGGTNAPNAPQVVNSTQQTLLLNGVEFMPNAPATITINGANYSRTVNVGAGPTDNSPIHL